MSGKLSHSLLVVTLGLVVALGLINWGNNAGATSLTSCEKLQLVKEKLTEQDPNHPGLVGVNNALSQQDCPATGIDCSEAGVSGSCTTEAACVGGVYIAPADSCSTTTGGCCITL